MITLCWAVKGGSGTTVVVASTALASRQPTLIVDLDGDIPAVLGLPEPSGPGLFDWLHSPAPVDRLGDLTIAVSDHVTLLPRGRTPTAGGERWPSAIDWLRSNSGDVLIDAGTTPDPCAPLASVADRNLLVTRLCFLAMADMARMACRPNGVIVIEEPGRRIEVDDVIAVAGAPLVASILLDPKVARAADAGLLLASVPAPMRRALRSAA